MKFDPKIHHRRSLRLKGYDYTRPGAYFITLVSFQRDEIFGEVVDGEMKLSSLGQVAQDEWFKTAKLRPYVQLFEDEFVVMPNHAHGIIWLAGDADVGARRRRALRWKNLARRYPDRSQQSCGRINPRSRMRLTAHKTRGARLSGSEIFMNTSPTTKPKPMGRR